MIDFILLVALLPIGISAWWTVFDKVKEKRADWMKSAATLTPVVKIVLTPTEGRLEVLTNGEDRDVDVARMLAAQEELRTFLAKPYDKTVVDALHVFTAAMGGKVKLIVAP